MIALCLRISNFLNKLYFDGSQSAELFTASLQWQDESMSWDSLIKLVKTEIRIRPYFLSTDWTKELLDLLVGK